MAVTISGNGQIIKQVVSVTKVDTSVYSSIGSFTDVAGLAVTITPTSASNKIFIDVNITFSIAATTTCLFNLVRNGTNISQPSPTNTQNCSFRSQTANTAWATSASHTFLDSPATTSAVTYKIQFKPYSTDRTVFINRSSHTDPDVDGAFATSTITVYEVAYA